MSSLLIDDDSERKLAEDRLVDLLLSLYRDFRREDKGVFSPGDNILLLVPCESNYGLCAVPEVRLGPVDLILYEVEFDEDHRHARLTFSNRDFQIEYDTANLDAEFLYCLASIVKNCLEAMSIS